MITSIQNARGKSWEAAVEHAIAFGNRKGPGRKRMDRAERFLARAGWIRATFGREYVGCADRELCYLNTGDTYDLTVCQEGDGKLFASSWGDWQQEAENEHCQDNDLIS
jgi:hypothetical protein